MAYRISDTCTRCGDCVATCPNEAIRKLPAGVRVRRELCTECIGYDDSPVCVEVCGCGAIVFDQTPWEPVAPPAGP